MQKTFPALYLAVATLLSFLLVDQVPGRADNPPAAAPVTNAPSTNSPAAAAAPAAPIFSTDFETDPFTPDQFVATPMQAATWDQTTVHQGKGSVKMVNNDPASSVNVYSNLIPFTGGTMRLSFEAKTDNILSGAASWEKAGVQIYYFDANKVMIDYRWKSYNDQLAVADGYSDWKVHDKPINLPATTGVAYVRVCLSMLHTTGTVWIDQVRLVPQP